MKDIFPKIPSNLWRKDLFCGFNQNKNDNFIFIINNNANNISYIFFLILFTKINRGNNKKRDVADNI
jgi:hypothetical protein